VRGDVVVEELGQERWQVGGPDRPVLGSAEVEPAPELVELPLDTKLVGVYECRAEADRLAPPHAGVGDRDDHHEVGAAAGQRSATLGDDQRLKRRRPRLLGPLVQFDSTALAPLASSPLGRVAL
jgi:hypothetical protein